MGHLKFEHTQPYEKHFWKKKQNRLKTGVVWKRSTQKNKILQFSDGEALGYDSLILATGSKPNRFGWKGQEAQGVLGPLPQTGSGVFRKIRP